MLKVVAHTPGDKVAICSGDHSNWALGGVILPLFRLPLGALPLPACPKANTVRNIPYSHHYPAFGNMGVGYVYELWKLQLAT